MGATATRIMGATATRIIGATATRIIGTKNNTISLAMMTEFLIILYA